MCTHVPVYTCPCVLVHISWYIPFGIAQIGKVFRNEIAPRAGLTRQREFQQAEIEFFIKPKKYDHPKYEEIKGVEVTL